MRFLVCAWLLVALAPVAAAECVGAVCVTDDATGPAGCPSVGDYAYAESSASASAGPLYLRAGGSAFCYNDFENGAFSSENVFLQAGTPAGWTYVAWTQSTGGCSVYVGSALVPAFEPCPGGVPPPNPGWGSLLP